MMLRTDLRFANARRAGLALLALGLLTMPRVGVALDDKMAAYQSIAGAEKVDTRLLDIALTARRGTNSLTDSVTKLPVRKVGNGVVLEIVAPNIQKSTIEALSRAGATVLTSSPKYGRLTVTTDNIDTVLAMAQIDGITHIRPVIGPVSHTGSTNSGAEVAENTDLASVKYDATGILVPDTNPTDSVDDAVRVKVGVLSDSFNATTGVHGPATTPDLGGAGALSNAKNQVSGDLPADVNIIRDFPGGSDEGAAMAELVYDIAPDVTIAFNTGAIGGQAGFAAGIDALVADGANVIVDDLYYPDEPTFQDGPVAASATAAVNRGIPYFSAAGNSANQGIRETYRDAASGDEQSIPSRGNDLHRWSATGNGYLPITLQPGAGVLATIQWNQPSDDVIIAGVQSKGAQVDLDAYLLLSPDADGLEEAISFVAGNEGRRGKEPQGITDHPNGAARETVSYVNTGTSPKTLYLAVDHYRGSQGNIPQAPVPTELSVSFFSFNGTSISGLNGVAIAGIDPEDNSTGGPTIFGHATAAGVVSVGAVNYVDTPNNDTTYGPTAAIDPERFTAKGGASTVYFNTLGDYAPRTSFEPDVAAVDGTNTTFFSGADFDIDGFPNFFGTSAAAPNAAAIAALMLDYNPVLTPAQIELALKSTAIDVTGSGAAVGVDNVSGAGLVNALTAMDYVADQFGSGGSGDAPTRRSYFFDAGGDGWTAAAAPGFTAPGASASSGAISLTATDNVNTLGWWSSPEFALSKTDSVGGGAVSIRDTATGTQQNILRASYRVSSSAATPGDTPVFRLRSSTQSFEQSDMIVVTSTGNNTLSPGAGPSKTYRQYFTIPASQSRFRLYFELLSFDPADAAGTTVSAEEAIVQSFDDSALIDSRNEAELDFTDGSQGFSKRDVKEVFGSAKGSTSGGLTLGGVADDETRTVFSFFNSNEDSPVITLGVNRLYAATFTVKTDLPDGAGATAPTFRLRANDSSFQFSSIVNVESTGTGANVPTGSNSRDYVLYFESPADLIGNGVNFSFDFLWVPGSDNNGNVKVTVTDLKVVSYARPL